MIQKEMISSILVLTLLFAITGCRVGANQEHMPSSPTRSDPNITPALPGPALPPETIAIFEPKAMQPISGGALQVSGYSEYFFESNLSLALCGAGGSGAPHPVCGTVDNVIAESYATIEALDIGQSGPFGGSLSYQIDRTVNARLVVYAQSPRDGGVLHASSVNLELNP